MSSSHQDVRNQYRLPTLYFKLTVMTPSPHFRHRYDSRDGTWLPPRPLGSNISNEPAIWYKYEGGITTRLRRAPDSRSRQLYRTYSFYCSAQKLFIYPADALRKEVGDGTDNPRISRSISPEAPAHNSSDDSSDDTDVGDGRDEEDWGELAFSYDFREGAYISHAASRGYHGTRLCVQWPDRGQIRELLPSRNHADGTRVVNYGHGGMTGEIAVLVALVVYSVSPESVERALQHCLRNMYHPHGSAPGQGWRDGRGLVVSVWHERESSQGTSAYTASAASIAAQMIRMFEEGRLPGYGKFVH